MFVDAVLEVGWLQGLRWRELESPTWKVIIRMGGGRLMDLKVCPSALLLYPRQWPVHPSTHTQWAHGLGWMF